MMHHPSRLAIRLTMLLNSSSCEAVPSWWLERIVLPLIFLVVGAALGRVKDWLDEHKARKAFLGAIRIELSEIRGHLQGTLKDAQDTKNTFGGLHPHAYHLLPVFQTGIYSSQVGKIKDVRDTRIPEIIRFYDRLSNLERIKSRATTLSYELPTLNSRDTEKAQLLGREYASVLDEVIRRINLLLPEVEGLITRLSAG